VGWTLSLSPGARQDVHSVLEWEFLVLLLDVFLVVVYFILAKTVDITGETTVQLKASARPEAIWVFVIFAVYFIWDVVTKVVVYLKQKRAEPWFRSYGARMIPTFVCLVLAWVTLPLFENADAPHVLTADFALLCLVLLFRAGKALAESFSKPDVPKKWPIVWTLVFLAGFGLGSKWTSSWPMFKRIAAEIQKVPAEPTSQPEATATSTQDSRSVKSDK